MRLWRKCRCRFRLIFVWLISLSIAGGLYWYITRDEFVNIKDIKHELLWWTEDMHWRYDEIRNCGLETCRITNNRQRLSKSRAVLFYGSNMKTHDFPIPRSSRQLWALLHEESPRNVPFVPYDDFLQHFNFTSTFSRYSDFPLTTQYLPQASDLSQPDFHMGHYNKGVLGFNAVRAPVVFLQTDCNTMSGREDYVRELMKHIRVDSFGGCLHNRDLPARLQKDYLNNLYSPDLMRFLAPYKFMIAIENGVCEDYITEKFWRPLIGGIIPIYFGSPSIRDWQPHNKSAIYVDDYRDAITLAAYLHQINDNASAYQAYMGHKLNRKHPIDNDRLLNNLLTRRYHMEGGHATDENSLFRKFECFMCQQAIYDGPSRRANKRHYNCSIPPKHVPLEQNKEPKYAADWRSMMKVGHCQAQLLNVYWRANQKYTKMEFETRLSKMVERNMCD